MTTGALAGRRLMFDYGQNAKFLLRFSHAGEVEVTALAGVVYSVTSVATFPVETRVQSPDEYEIRWRDPAEQTAFTHVVDFAAARVSVVIEDDRLKEVRRFEGTVSTA